MSLSRTGKLSRRGLLRAGLLAAGAKALAPLEKLWGAAPAPPAKIPSVVAMCSDEQAFRGTRAHERYLRDLVDQTVITVSGQAKLTEAWGSFVKPGESILLKFPSLSGAELGTSLPLLEALLSSLEQVGHKRQNIRVADCPYAAYVPGLARLAEGWGPTSVRAAGIDQPLRRYLEDVDGIINVPCLCDHSLVGVGCAMVNVSLHFIRYPGRYAGKELHQAVADTCAAGEISGRIRLTMVNALRGVIQGGPVVEDSQTVCLSALWASTDMVAVDRLALDWLDRTRRTYGLPALADDEQRRPAFLAQAAQRGLGCDDLGWITRRRRSS